MEKLVLVRAKYHSGPATRRKERGLVNPSTQGSLNSEKRAADDRRKRRRLNSGPPSCTRASCACALKAIARTAS